jgi:hypothetical protein
MHSVAKICASLRHHLQWLQCVQGVCAEFSLTEVCRVSEQRLGVCITRVSQVRATGRGNVSLELAGPHGANGARRVFKLRGFSRAVDFMNANWASFSVSPDNQQRSWVSLDVTMPHPPPDMAARLVQEARALGPHHVLESVFNLENGGCWLTHLQLEGVHLGGQQLSGEELTQVMQCIQSEPPFPI